jgi:hypothetical protein
MEANTLVFLHEYKSIISTYISFFLYINY